MPPPPRFFLSVCVCIKNERPYLAEFIRHYLAQGADHVYIVDNGSTDGGAEAVLREYSDASSSSVVTVLRDARDFRILADDSGAAGHSRMLTENLFVRLRNETQWAIIVDADEFMFGKNGHTLRTYLQALPDDVSRVYVFWNIISPPRSLLLDGDGDGDGSPSSSPLFQLGQNRRRINYDRCYNGSLGENALHANMFGKSMFRPARTRLADGLWIHKVFTEGGRAITNYGDDHPDFDYADNRPFVAHSEEAYRRLDVTLHHYALRDRADCAKKQAQLATVPHKAPFIRGLFDLLHHPDDAAFVDADELGGDGVPGDGVPATVATESSSSSHQQQRRRCCLALCGGRPSA